MSDPKVSSFIFHNQLIFSRYFEDISKFSERRAISKSHSELFSIFFAFVLFHPKKVESFQVQFLGFYGSIISLVIYLEKILFKVVLTKCEEVKIYYDSFFYFWISSYVQRINWRICTSLVSSVILDNQNAHWFRQGWDQTFWLNFHLDIDLMKRLQVIQNVTVFVFFTR